MDEINSILAGNVVGKTIILDRLTDSL